MRNEKPVNEIQLLMQFEQDVNAGRLEKEETIFYRDNITDIREAIERKRKANESAAIRAIINHIELLYGK